MNMSETSVEKKVELFTIREIPDHATFRQKGVNTVLVRQASFTKFNKSKKCIDRLLFPNMNHLGLQVFCTF